MRCLIGIALISFLSSPVFAQHILTVSDSTTYSKKYVSSSCIPFEHPMFTNIKMSCTVYKFESLFIDQKGEEWFLAEYSASGLLKRIQKDTSISMNRRSQVHSYPVFMMLKMTKDQGFQGSFAVSSDGDMEGATYREPEIGMSSFGPLLTTTLRFHPYAEKQYFYLLNENEWHEVESSGWEDNLPNYLSEGQYLYYELRIDPSDLTVETSLFDREWRGVGDNFEDAEKLGSAHIKLGIKNYRFFIKQYDFNPAR